MNREIKFRIWDKNQGVFVNPTISYTDNKWFYFGGVYELHEKGLTLQQFTGLKDKNGVEIYEGDILKNTQYGNKFKIEWAKEIDYCGFVTINLKDEFRNLFLAKNFVNCEVIGNIFENPELAERARKGPRE